MNPFTIPPVDTLGFSGVVLCLLAVWLFGKLFASAEEGHEMPFSSFIALLIIVIWMFVKVYFYVWG